MESIRGISSKLDKVIAISKGRAFLWLCFAVSFPLFSVEYLRMGDVRSGLSLSLPQGLLLVIFIFEITANLINGKNIPHPFYKMGSLFSGLLVLFLCWGIFSLLFLDGHPTGVMVLFKLAFSFICMCGIIIYFPKDQEFLEKFWKTVIWSSAVLIGTLIFRYAFIFKVSYLSIQWDEADPGGKNQLSFFLVFLVPLSIFYVTASRKKLISLIPTLLFVVGLFYSASRSGILPVVIGIMVVSFKGFKDGAVNFKRVVGSVVVIALVVYVAILSVEFFVEDPEFVKRFDYSNSDRFEQLKDENRWELLVVGWEAFLNAPIVGIGIQNSNYLFKFHGGAYYLHNDYLKILSEFGLVGFTIFGMIIWTLVIRVIFKPSNNSNKILWVELGVQASLISGLIRIFFDNVYFTPFLWIFFALILVSTENEWNAGEEELVQPRVI